MKSNKGGSSFPLFSGQPLWKNEIFVRRMLWTNMAMSHLPKHEILYTDQGGVYCVSGGIRTVTIMTYHGSNNRDSIREEVLRRSPSQ